MVFKLQEKRWRKRPSFPSPLHHFDLKILRAPKKKKKRIKLAVGDVRDPPTEFVLLFSGDAIESQLRYLTTTRNPFSFDTTTSQVVFSLKKQSFRFFLLFLLDKLSGNPTQIDGWLVDCVCCIKKWFNLDSKSLLRIRKQQKSFSISKKNKEFIKSSFCVCGDIFSCSLVIFFQGAHTFSATCHAGWVSSKRDYAITWPRRRCIGIYFARPPPPYPCGSGIWARWFEMKTKKKKQLNFVTLFLFSHQNDDDDDPRLSTQSASLSRPPADVCQGKNKSQRRNWQRREKLMSCVCRSVQCKVKKKSKRN